MECRHHRTKIADDLDCTLLIRDCGRDVGDIGEVAARAAFDADGEPNETTREISYHDYRTLLKVSL